MNTENKNNEFKQKFKKIQEKNKNDNNIMNKIGKNARITLEIIKKGKKDND